MYRTLAQIRARLAEALVRAFGPELRGQDPLLGPSKNPEFGDLQANLALPLAKRLGKPPRAIAEAVVQTLDVAGLAEPPSVAGPGFINLRLLRAHLEAELARMHADPRLCVAPAEPGLRVVIDFSSPNIAKQMHVGHLRSTIIGDSLARVLEFLGHDVVRLNHVGDWGTQFGMLITYLRETEPAALTAAGQIELGDLVAFYKRAKARFDEDPAFQEAAREEVVRLQSGNAATLQAWQLLCDQSRREFQAIYDQLGVRLTERGESFYNPLLAGVVADLKRAGLLREDQGARCVFVEGFTNKEGDPLPLIVQKKDGGYNYATTDLAAIRHRVSEERAERIIYVTDAGQADHFAQVFATARRAGFAPDAVELVHVPFGVVQGEDGKKFKTRSGETVLLQELLDEAVTRARSELDAHLAEEGREEDEAFRKEVSRVIGLAAVKYADLAQNRTSNYVFSFDKMLSLQGNTAPYLLYAYVRIQGIIRKGQIDLSALGGEAIHLETDAERALSLELLRLDEVIGAVAADLFPNRLCQYLYGLSQTFNSFYHACPVLTSEEPLRTSRLVLCDLTARTIGLGLSLLGIGVLDRM